MPLDLLIKSSNVYMMPLDISIVRTGSIKLLDSLEA